MTRSATDQRYRDRLGPVIDHVRANLGGDLRVEALARVVHFSPYHFHRVFTAVMGETVGTFVRRARLERAVALLKASPGATLTAVSREAGFGSLSDFSRTFRRHYGMAPSRWDRRSPLVFRAAGEAGALAGPGDLRAMVAEDEGAAPEVVLRETPATGLAYVRIRRPFEPGALDAGYRRLREWLARRGFDEGHLFGLSWDDVEVTPPDRIRYDMASTVPAGTEADADGVGVRDLPPLVVASAHARGGLVRVAGVWDWLYGEWLPRSRYEPYNLPAFEWYRGWPEDLNSDEWDLDCCIPLKALQSP